MDFPPKCYFFVIVTLLWLVRLRAEVLLKRPIFAEVVAYQLIILNWKLNGYRWDKRQHRSILNENNQSICQRVNRGTFFIPAFNLCVKVAHDDVEVGFVVLHGWVEVVQNVSILLLFLDYEEKPLILAIFILRIFAGAREKVTFLPCLLNNYSSSPNGLLTQSPWGREE